MKCLIIAAGKGSRLQQRGDSKPLVPILGVPLIERVVRAAMEASADEFYVVIGYQGERVRLFLERLAERLAIRITPLVNDDWEKDNGLGQKRTLEAVTTNTFRRAIVPLLALFTLLAAPDHQAIR
jgi:choline kinase